MFLLRFLISKLETLGEVSFDSSTAFSLLASPHRHMITATTPSCRSFPRSLFVSNVFLAL